MRELRVNVTYYAARSYVDFPKNRDVVNGSSESSKFVILVSDITVFDIEIPYRFGEKAGLRARKMPLIYNNDEEGEIRTGSLRHDGNSPGDGIFACRGLSYTYKREQSNRFGKGLDIFLERSRG